MEWLLATLQIAVGAGLATTFDDNIYLTAFFGKVNRSFLPRHVVIGELIGFSILLSITSSINPNSLKQTFKGD